MRLGELSSTPCYRCSRTSTIGCRSKPQTLGFQRAFPEVGPAKFEGIELNPYAPKLPRVPVWIGGDPGTSADPLVGVRADQLQPRLATEQTLDVQVSIGGLIGHPRAGMI